MLDLKFIRDNADLVRQAVANRQSSAPIEEILALDGQRRQRLNELEELRHTRKSAGKERLTGEEAAAAGRALRDKIRTLDTEVSDIDAKLQDLLLQVPNIPAPQVPVGKSEDDNIVVRAWGEPRKFDFQPKTHWELGEALDIIDCERGVKLSGSRFFVLKGAGARLQRALIAYMLDVHTQQQDYREIYPPWMVKKETMVGSGNLPKFADNLYHDAEEDYWFVPTAEVPLTNLFRDEILSQDMLPIYYVAHTACFRREKMSAGKDTRGIKRGHQFEKVEMYKFTSPETSYDELEKLVDNAEDVSRRLGLTYHVLSLCTGDIGFASAKSYDIEMWAPGCKEWLEVSSCSNCIDFQARRTNIRFRPEGGGKPQFVHTLNGSGMALPRVMISIIENYQQADGSIVVPEALRPYTGFDAIK